MSERERRERKDKFSSLRCGLQANDGIFLIHACRIIGGTSRVRTLLQQGAVCSGYEMGWIIDLNNGLLVLFIEHGHMIPSSLSKVTSYELFVTSINHELMTAASYCGAMPFDSSFIARSWSAIV